MIDAFNPNESIPPFKVVGIPQCEFSLTVRVHVWNYSFPDPDKLTDVGLTAVRGRDVNSASLIPVQTLQMYVHLATPLFKVCESLQKAKDISENSDATAGDSTVFQRHIAEAMKNLKSAHDYFMRNSTRSA